MLIGVACSLQACLRPPPLPDPVGQQPTSAPEAPPVQYETSNINGSVVDLDTSQPVPRAEVSITDVLGRTLMLHVDEAGAFRFENVPPGTTTIAVSAPGYQSSVTEFEVAPAAELFRRFPLRQSAEAP